jgi:endonuclease YncB( thermonuclease family)
MTVEKLLRYIILGGIAYILLMAVIGMEKARADYGPYALEGAIAIDGDTVRGDVLIWMDQTVNVAVRVAGIDAPEIKAATQCERDKALAARNFADNWLLNNMPVTISRVKHDKFAGRVDANITGRTGSLAAALLAAGHARPYTGGTRGAWCQ